METKNRRITPAAAAVGVAFDLVLVRELFFYYNFPAYLLGALALFLGYAMKKSAEIRNGRLHGCCAVFSILFSAACVAGGKVDVKTMKTAPLYRSDAVYFLALAAAFFFFSSWLAGLILKHPFSPAVKAGRSPGKLWAACAVFFFACWIPCLLVYYPGSISPDSLTSIVSAVGRAGLSNHQPVFYTLLMKPFLLFALSIGKSLNFGSALFLLFQAAAMAVLLGYFPCWLTKRGFPRWTVWLAVAYFVLDPVFPMYSVTMWKDIPFSGLLLVYILNIFDIVRSGGKWLGNTRSLAWFLLLNVLLAFLRNNGYFIIFITLVVLTLVYRKSWKRLAPAFLAVLVVVPVIQGPVYDACGVEKSPFAESVGIPLQQIGYTVANGGKMTPEQREFVGQLLPLDEMKKDYTPFSSNGIKFQHDFNGAFLEKNKAGFLKVWFEMMGSNASGYLKAYMMETLGYWHMGTMNWVLYYGIRDGYGAKENGLSMSNLWNLAKNRSSIQQTFLNLQNDVPFFSWLVNTGFLFWAAVFSAMMMVIRKKGKLLLAYLPLLVLWGTLMIAAPTFCEFRYVFAFAVAFPAMVAFSLAEREVPRRKPGAPSGN